MHMKCKYDFQYMWYIGTLHIWKESYILNMVDVLIFIKLHICINFNIWWLDTIVNDCDKHGDLDDKSVTIRLILKTFLLGFDKLSKFDNVVNLDSLVLMAG